MKSPRTASHLSAAALVLVTLWAFWNLQNTGPEGTLRRFFELSANGNWPEINRLLAPAEEQLETLSLPEQYAVRQARRIGQVGSYRVQRRRTPDSRRAIIAVQYDDPAFGPNTSTWVLARPSLRWTIDLKSTVMVRAGYGTNIAPEP